MAARVTRAAAKAAALSASEPSPRPNTPQQLSSPPETPSPNKRSLSSKPSDKTVRSAKAKKATRLPTPASGRKRKRGVSEKQLEDINELPHNLGTRYPTTEASSELIKTEEGSKLAQAAVKDEPAQAPGQVKEAARGLKAKYEALLSDPAVLETVEKLATEVVPDPDESPKKKARKAKANPYGLTPGETPFPDWPHPTSEECQTVNDLLSDVHGVVTAPATIPAPSTTVSGCGEVPSVLDALIRTLLSAATTGTNSSRAFKGLVEKFGILQEGVGKGSVNWEKVRRADVKQVFEAIKSGGLAAVKSKRIKEILEMVREQNITRRNALVAEKDGDGPSGIPGAGKESALEKQAEIARADESVLSLDHLHALSSDEALNELIKYPGIGPKTASCVLLFCLQRPSFAVDTHVFRLCKWLNWVPPDKATRNTAYSHCEVRIPDHLKYSLHQLFIRHGKTCPRCRAATGEGGADWDKGCPIDHLVKRTGKRKGALDKQPTKAGKKGAKKRRKDDEDEDESDPTEDEGEGEMSEIDPDGAADGDDDE